MTSSEYDEIVSSFSLFAHRAARFLHIARESDYLDASALIEQLMDAAEDSRDDPRNALIDRIARAVSDYEAQSEQFADFDRELGGDDTGMAALSIGRY